MLLFSIYMLLWVSNNRASAYILTFAQVVMFVLLLAIQAGVSALLGEWSPYFSNTISADMTISTSMVSYLLNPITYPPWNIR
jgi:hypothetical protein